MPVYHLQHTSDGGFSEIGAVPAGSVLLLGYFDGVHLGHRELILEGARSAKEKIKVNNIVSNNENAKFEKRMADIKAKIEKWECLANEGYVPAKKPEETKSFEDLEKEATIDAELKKLKEAI